MTQLQNTKSILAKLLASENITISHQSVQTAYFDLQSRTLVCPIWQDMDGDLYDLLMGHEVGHALNTPMEGWHNALRDESGNPVPKAFKDFLNVLEDARIEKKIKRKYPGLAKSFANAYKSLHQKNFFGIRDVNLENLNFIDRINIYFKMGAHTHVPWRNDFERDILREVGELETWEEVVELAKRIFEYVKEEEEPQIKNEQDLQDMKDQQKMDAQQQMQEAFGDEQEEENDDDYGDAGDYDSDEDYDDEEGEGADGSNGGSSDDEESEDSADGGLGDGETGEEESSSDEDSPVAKYGRQEYNNPIQSSKKEQQTQKVDSDPESITDRAFRRREQELINESGHVFMLNLPEANLDKIILQNSIVMRDLEAFYQKQISDPSLNSVYYRNKVSYEAVAAKCVKKFNARNKKYIMHIFKEFDMRKRATDYARTSIARTGELNMNVLHKYKFSNDLFKKIAVVQKGKSHGLIMYVDMSGSMHDILKNTIEQTLVLVSFCKLANIPFEVYGFTNDYYHTELLRNRPNDQIFISDEKTEMCLYANGFHLKHLIGSSLSSVAYRRSFNNLAILINEYTGDRHNPDHADTGYFQYDWTDGGFGLNGTPYIETLLASRGMIKKFRVDNKLDIVNVLYLTDGDGNTNLSVPESVRNISWDVAKKATYYYIDKKTQRKVRKERYESEQSAITRLVKDITGCKHLGFYLVDKRTMRDQLATIDRDAEFGKNGYTTADVDKMRKCARENNFFAASNIGYDKYFYIGSSNKNITEEELVITQDMTKNKMARTFSKTLSSKKSNRILVSQFAQELAVGM